LPGRYPNRLDPEERMIDAVVFRPEGRGPTPHAARGVAQVPNDASIPRVFGRVTFADQDGDGREDAVVSLSTSGLRSGGMLARPAREIEIRIEGDRTTWTGTDRLFDSDAELILLPQPSGPGSVGTSSGVLYDRTRPGNGSEGRALLLRLWYPALPTEAQPAPYFLDERQAERNLEIAALPLPPDLFELTHSFARAEVPPVETEPLPLVLLSTGWGAAVETYTALAEDLASHGYVVLGINHPNGSGALVYPDGSEPALDPTTVLPDENNNRDWALDLERAAEWLASGGPAAGAERDPASLDSAFLDAAAQAALGRVDPVRIAAAGHGFGGSAAVRADADSDVIRASVDLDGALMDTAAVPSSRALLMLSAGHWSLDPSFEVFRQGAGPGTHVVEIAGMAPANFGDTNWLLRSVLEGDPNLGAAALGLGSIDPTRAHLIVTGFVKGFLDEALEDTPSPLLAGPSNDFPEVSFR
jgi:predicted dienelactone hydrolase